MFISLSFALLLFKATLGFLFVIKYIESVIIIIDKTDNKINRSKIPIKNAVEKSCDKIRRNNENKINTCENEQFEKYVGGSQTYSGSGFSDDSNTHFSLSTNHSNYYLRKSKIPKYVTSLWKHKISNTPSSSVDNRPPFKKYVTPMEKNFNVDYSNDLKNIEIQVQNQINKCCCSSQFRVQKVSDNNNAIMYEFGNFNPVKRHVKIYNSTVTIRVGGGWESLEEFFHKIDPCRITKNRYNQLYDISTISKQKLLESNFNETFLTPYTSSKGFKKSETPLRRPKKIDTVDTKNLKKKYIIS